MTREERFEDLTDGISINNLDPDAYTAYVKASRLLLRDLQIASGELAVLVNGRVSCVLPSKSLHHFLTHSRRSLVPSKRENSLQQIFALWRVMNTANGQNP